MVGGTMMKTVDADLFVTCLVDSFFPDVAECSVRLLRRAGVRPAFRQRRRVAANPCSTPAFVTWLGSKPCGQ